jgi:monovalent cation/proton antiporter MnhG/PhaG subunit
MSVLGSIFMAVGALLSILAAYGLIDFPTALSRMHAATKSASLGLALITLGAGFAAASWPLIGIALLVTAFLFATAPISGHLLGRAAYLAGQAPGLVHDDLAGADVHPVRVDPVVRRDFSVLRWLALVIVWMLVWRDVSIGTAIGGGLVAALVEGLRGSIDRPRAFRPSGVPAFVAGYLDLVVRSNLRVAWEVLTPSNEDIREAVVRVELSVDSLAAALLVANAITYTPGTLSIELTSDPQVLYIHALHFESVAETTSQVREIESLVRKVIPDQTSV